MPSIKKLDTHMNQMHYLYAVCGIITLQDSSGFFNRINPDIRKLRVNKFNINRISDDESNNNFPESDLLTTRSPELSEIYIWSLRYNATTYSKDLYQYQSQLISNGHFARDALASTYITYNDTNSPRTICDYYQYIRYDTLHNGNDINVWKTLMLALETIHKTFTPESCYIALRPSIESMSSDLVEFTDALYTDILHPTFNYLAAYSWFVLYTSSVAAFLHSIGLRSTILTFVGVCDILGESTATQKIESINDLFERIAQDHQNIVFLTVMNFAIAEAQISDAIDFTLKTRCGALNYEWNDESYFADKRVELREYAAKNNFSIYDNHHSIIKRFENKSYSNDSEMLEDSTDYADMITDVQNIDTVDDVDILGED